MARGTPMHRVTYSVVGAGAFPIDMLRYDASAPEHSDDASLVTESILAPSISKGPRTIKLFRWAERTWTPEEGRWRSFGWQVVAGSRTVR